ncbi:MAG: transporter [Candidatus Babeliales bacterium]
MKTVSIFLVLLFKILTLFAHAAAHEPIPINGKFSIGRETITSKGYGSYVTGSLMFIGHEANLLFYFNAFSYGISERVGCTFTVPIVLHFRENKDVSRGLFDLRFNMQWHLYRSENEIVVLKTGMWFPTGDILARPPLSFGSFNPTVYLIAAHSSERLYANATVGSVITTTRKHRNTGGFIDYHLSVGPKFPLDTKNHSQLYAFLELQGYYFFAAKFRNVRVPNTGEHLLFLGPSVSYDSDFFQILASIGVTVLDHRKGIQPRTDFLAQIWFGRRF